MNRNLMHLNFAKTYDLISKTHSILLNSDKAKVLWKLTRQSALRQKYIMEIGVYKGGASLLMSCAYGPNFSSKQYLIDPFIGHQQSSISNNDNLNFHHEGHFSDTSSEEVRELYSRFGFKEPSIIQDEIQNLYFSHEMLSNLYLIHLDTDLYLPTKYVLEELATKCQKGAYVLVDDYSSKKCPGVKKAIEEIDSNKFTSFTACKDQIILRKL